MVSGKRIADVGYKMFSGSMMLLTVYGGYLFTVRIRHYLQIKKQLELEAQSGNTTSEAAKE